MCKMFVINRLIFGCKRNDMLISSCRSVHYIQGQSPERKIREYFYYIDHQGQLFLDDAKMKNFTSCIKEKKFLQFFFKRLKMNNTDRYREFPYISPCGPERNFVRCDDCPIVFTQVIDGQDGNSDLFSYNNAGDLLSTIFEPDKVCMLPESGRIYHPASSKVGGYGLIKSSLAIEFSKSFEFNQGQEGVDPPTHFTWKGHRYTLSNQLAEKIHLDKIEQET